MGKRERHTQIEYLLLQQTLGLRRAEIARRLGVHKATISRDIAELSLSFPVIESDEGYLRIDKRGYLSNVSLNMFELEALHLAARLFLKDMRFPFPHAASALRKLAAAQGKVSHSLAERIKESAEEIDEAASRFPQSCGHYREITEKLGLAISEMRPVTISHYSSRKRCEQTFIVLPVTLEPHPEGKAVHLAAWEHTATPPGFRTLKVERISSIFLHDPGPDLFRDIPIPKLKERLSHAWSIWTSDKKPVTVILHFSSSVASRVNETQWHSSQVLQLLDDGSLLWTGCIAEPREMYPWIRGWGPDVEIKEPSWLRQTHQEDFYRGVELYRDKDEDIAVKK
jgi:predicted DNA-binding transcriptional regulator YafY